MKIFFVLLLAACTAMAGARLTWDPNPVIEGVSKYVIYHSSTPIGGFTNFAEVPAMLLPAFPLPPLRSGAHFFFVTAVSTNGLESDPSNQVLAPVPNPPQGLKIVITIP